MGIDENEAGTIMQAAYTVIRMRTLPTFGKLHDIMRTLPKYTRHGKAHLLELARNTKHEIPAEDLLDAQGNPLSLDVIEEKWKNKYRTEATRRLILAREASQSGSEKSAPLVPPHGRLEKADTRQHGSQ